MSKAEEATNDFCTRCFKYGKCHKVQSECTMADSYNEGYGDGYHQAEKDLELSWEDIKEIYCITLNLREHLGASVFGEPLYQEVLKRFNEKRKK